MLQKKKKVQTNKIQKKGPNFYLTLQNQTEMFKSSWFSNVKKTI